MVYDQDNINDEDHANIRQILFEMGYQETQIQHAITACGEESSVCVLSDFIQAHYGIDGGNQLVENGIDVCKEQLDKSSQSSYEDTQDDVIKRLREMGFLEKEVKHAIEACGKETPVFVLADFIEAHYRNEQEQEKINLNARNINDEMKEVNPTRALLEMGFSEWQVKYAIAVCGEENSIFVLSDFIQAHISDREVVNFHKSHKRKDPEREDSSCNDGEGNDPMDKLLEMGFSQAQAEKAIEACGKGSPIFILSDFIQAHYSGYDEGIHFHDAENSKSTINMLCDECDLLSKEKSSTLFPLSSEDTTVPCRKRKARKSKSKESEKHRILSRVDAGNMTGFGVPACVPNVNVRRLDAEMAGPPYFYFENAGMSRSAWDTIQRHFDGVEPEFVDSKYFSVLARECGYVHNLPVEGRELIIKKPPMTIKQAFPESMRYWPPWDDREKLECITKRRATGAKCAEVKQKFTQYAGKDIPECVQGDILSTCKEFNLIWVGPGEVANLDPHEIEMILGFDQDHTRGFFAMMDRLKVLASAFHIHTIAYHLSPLCRIYHDGIRVLSLFAGIGGAEVALYKIGIPLKHVVCVEINEKCRNVVQSWWRKTEQESSRIIFIEDVQSLTYENLSIIFEDAGGFDLVIGGSPCSDPSGLSIPADANEDSRLFYEFTRVLNIVKEITRRTRSR